MDRRRCARNRDWFFDRADRHVGVDRHNAGAEELDTLTDDGLESAERERHPISARTEILNDVAAFSVSCCGAALLDQHWARCFDAHAWEHRSRRVFHDPAE